MASGQDHPHQPQAWTVRAALGDGKVALKCKALGDTPITVKWTKVCISKVTFTSGAPTNARLISILQTDGQNVLSGGGKGRYLLETFTVDHSTLDQKVTGSSAKDDATATSGLEAMPRHQGKGVMSVLTIKEVSKADEDLYRCGMTNPFGSDLAYIRLEVQGKAILKDKKID